jgi:uncharacterized coiled-coil DUF342 family protein
MNYDTCNLNRIEKLEREIQELRHLIHTQDLSIKQPEKQHFTQCEVPQSRATVILRVGIIG